MHTVIVCRSNREEAEDVLLELAVQQYNVSRLEAQWWCVQRRVVNPKSYAAAVALLDEWVGSDAQVSRVWSIATLAMAESCARCY